MYAVLEVFSAATALKTFISSCDNCDKTPRVWTRTQLHVTITVLLLLQYWNAMNWKTRTYHSAPASKERIRTICRALKKGPVRSWNTERTILPRRKNPNTVPKPLSRSVLLYSIKTCLEKNRPTASESISNFQKICIFSVTVLAEPAKQRLVPLTAGDGAIGSGHEEPRRSQLKFLLHCYFLAKLGTFNYSLNKRR